MKFNRKLGFILHDVINTKQQTIIESIKDISEWENMQREYSVLGYRIDLYFRDYKLAVEVDELDMMIEIIIMRHKNKKAIEKDLGRKLIRINPDKQNFNERKAINEIYRHIEKLTKESAENSTKKSLIDEISRRLFKLIS